jgi:hypothetical protein
MQLFGYRVATDGLCVVLHATSPLSASRESLVFTTFNHVYIIRNRIGFHLTIYMLLESATGNTRNFINRTYAYVVINTLV